MRNLPEMHMDKFEGRAFKFTCIQFHNHAFVQIRDLLCDLSPFVVLYQRAFMSDAAGHHRGRQGAQSAAAHPVGLAPG